MSTKNYGSVAYWDERYAKQRDVTFDWVEQYAEIRPQLNELVITPIYEDWKAEQERIKRDKEINDALTELMSGSAPESAP